MTPDTTPGLPLTKTMAPLDFSHLHHLSTVEEHFYSASPQDEHRKWEYAMALEALEAHGRGFVFDVGGAGSPFKEMVLAHRDACGVIDPNVNGTLEQWHRAHPEVQYSRVVSISVIEHVEFLEPFVHALTQAVQPGGLLFLTTDCWDREGIEDVAHFAWMRRRIYTPRSWRNLGDYLTSSCGFEYFGEQDWSYNGNQVYDYSFISLALRKKEE